jgi:hypothetical protein
VLSLALDMRTVFVKRLELPPLPLEERLRVVSMDPQRYFPVREESLTAGGRDDDLVVATRTETLDAWVDALSVLGSVERIEPATAALARHMGGDGLLFLVDPDAAEGAVARVTAGRIETLRKVPADADALAAAAEAMGGNGGHRFLFPWSRELADDLATRLGGPPLENAPAPPDAPDSFAVARGALLGLGQGPELTLVSPALEGRLRALGRRRAFVHVAALVVALGLLGWSVDHRRESTLAALEEQVRVGQAQAVPVLDLRTDAASLAEELAFLARASGERPDPLEVLSAVSRILPQDAYLTHLTVSGGEWELNGLARDAARLVPELEGSDSFTDVRFRSATTRVFVRGETLERFSIVFRHVPAT